MLVTSPEDILGIKHKTISKKLPQTLNTIEKKIFESLLQESSSVDELSAQLGISVVEVSNTTSMMQLKGLITEAAGKYYANQ